MLVKLLHTPVCLGTGWLEHLLEFARIRRDGLSPNHIVLVRHCTNLYPIDNVDLHHPSALSLCTAVTCPSLPDPTNGRVSYGSRDYTSAATYTCDFGYELFGSVTHICQANGVWSGLETSCQRMSRNKYYYIA